MNSELREKLQSSDFNSVTTCLYWIDYLDPRVRDFYEEYSEVTCLGYRSASANEAPWHDIGGRVNFLYQLHKLLSKNEIVVCDEISTAAMAALTLGKKVYICRDLVKFQDVGRRGPFVLNELDNRKILNDLTFDYLSTPLGYEISRSNACIDTAFSGFGFDLSMSETQARLKSLLSTENPMWAKDGHARPTWLNCEW